MRYFYTKKSEKEYLKNTTDKSFWFGDLMTALSYAERYHGGINAYKLI